MSKTILYTELEKKCPTGWGLFLSADNVVARGIKKAQKDAGFKNWDKNHVGWTVDMSRNFCTGEEDYPGVFDINMFYDEYKDKKVYVVPLILTKELQAKLIRETIREQQDDRLTNYAFLDFIPFKVYSILLKWFGIHVWIGRKKNKRNRYTCSQRFTKYIQDYHNMMPKENYIEVFPAQVADYLEKLGFDILEVNFNK